MKKAIILLVTVCFVFSAAAGSVAAKTNNSSLVTLQQIIDQLQEQIQTLKAQLAELLEQKEAGEKNKEQQQEAKETKKEVQATLRLTKYLGWGMSSDDVTLLQEFLATDPDIYPEGLVTGYFGSLTYRAVKRFQKLAGIEQVGIVGPKTTAKINELLEEGAGSSGKVPPGLLIAPGIRKKLGYTPLVPSGQELPPGIEKKINGSDDDDEDKEDSCIASGGTVATSTCCQSASDFPNSCLIGACGCSLENSHEVKICNCGEGKCFNGEECVSIEGEDVTPPVISGLDATGTTATSTTVIWTTDEEADSKVWYSTDPQITVGTSTADLSSADMAISHELALESLTASTTYYYLVTSTDEDENTATSSEESFVTLGE